MDNFELRPELAHPNAKKILTEDFYWSPINETSPFGNDDGSDAFYGFRQWRLSNKEISLTRYLNELFSSWDFPEFDIYEMDTLKIRKYISSNSQPASVLVDDQVLKMKEHFKLEAKKAGNEFNEKQFNEMMGVASSKMGGTFLLAKDNAIIAVGFGQFVFEGRIDEDIKELTKIAIRRELLPILIDRWDESYGKLRSEQLSKMLIDIDKMN